MESWQIVINLFEPSYEMIRDSVEMSGVFIPYKILSLPNAKIKFPKKSKEKYFF